MKEKFAKITKTSKQRGTIISILAGGTFKSKSRFPYSWPHRGLWEAIHCLNYPPCDVARTNYRPDIAG